MFTITREARWNPSLETFKPHFTNIYKYYAKIFVSLSYILSITLFTLYYILFTVFYVMFYYIYVILPRLNCKKLLIMINFVNSLAFNAILLYSRIRMLKFVMLLTFSIIILF